MGIASLDDLLKQRSGISGKRVLVRCDFNVPLKENETLLIPPEVWQCGNSDLIQEHASMKSTP